MVRVGDLIAIMEECDIDRDSTTIDTDSLEFEVNTVLWFMKIAIIIYTIII